VQPSQVTKPHVLVCPIHHTTRGWGQRSHDVGAPSSSGSTGAGTSAPASSSDGSGALSSCAAAQRNLRGLRVWRRTERERERERELVAETRTL
jgi:hypothetical protein